ncbi:MAG: hypothetical protein ACXABV_20310, partial [Candidatus Thorarchaeota archaeon]
MKRRVSNLGVALAMISILLIVAVVPMQTCAAEVWSDNFDSGLGEWNIILGDFSASGGVANATGEVRNPMPYPYLTHFNAMNRSSDVAVGTWSFDWYVPWQGDYDSIFLSVPLGWVNPGIHFIS